MSPSPTKTDETKILHFDCFSGLAGDMILGALIDLGLPLDVVESAVASLPISGYKVRVEKEKRSSITATRFLVDVDEAHQPHRHFTDIKNMIEESDLNDEVKSLAVKIFHTVAEAEAAVHGTTLEHVHFHEVGAVDSIVDIVGAAAAFNYFNATVTCAPVPLGHGMIRTEHGALPAPAPATLMILKGVPVEGTEIEAELTTPTGAAVIKTVASRYERFPAMIPAAVGFGAGSRTHETRPGLLRVVLGQPVDEKAAPRNAPCIVIEANIDDMTGEVAAHAAANLIEAGALDAWFEPIHMKKGRPALKLGILCRREDLDSMSSMLFYETTTIGLRYYQVGRYEMSRSLHEVETPWGSVRVKISIGPDGSKNAAPEFEDCRRVAKERGVPVKQVIAAAAGAALKLV